jgi:di/tricarboxylate transporter
MDLQAWWAGAVLVALLVALVTDRIRADLAVVTALTLLMVGGVLGPQEALAGLADPLVVMIAALFVVGEGLFQTGVADRAGQLALRGLGPAAGVGSVVMMLMGITAVMSAFLSSTGTVAVMLPVAMGMARQLHVSPSRLLLPVSYASLIGGMLTLIGTPPNLVVSSTLEQATGTGFGFLAFLPFGLATLVLGMGYLSWVGGLWLPVGRVERSEARLDRATMLAHWSLTPRLHRLRVPVGGRLGRLQDLAGADGLGMQVVHVEREVPAPRLGARRTPSLPPQDRVVGTGDVVWVLGDQAAVERSRQALGWDTVAGEAEEPLPERMGMAEVLIPPRSRLVGQTLREAGFRQRFGLQVLGLRRLGEAVEGPLADVALRFGDTLLVEGSWKRLALLRRDAADLALVEEPAELGLALRPLRRAPWAVGILAAMLAAMLWSGWPLVAVSVGAALLMVAARCVRPSQVYRVMQWESLVLIGGMLPVARVVEDLGGLAAAGRVLMWVSGWGGVLGVGAALFTLTSVASQVLSNSATCVVLAPLAVQVALTLGVRPEPLLMWVAVGASCAFATPIASPVNMLVMGPGQYRFMDFVRVGAPLQVAVLLLSLGLIPWLFPWAIPAA